MAELSTIARPYAQGLWKALEESKSVKNADEISQVLEALSVAVLNPQIEQRLSDPKLSDEQVLTLVQDTLGKDIPKELTGLLKAVVENGRMSALKEIAKQFRELKNKASGIADAYIDSAFKMSKTEVQELVKSLEKKFPNVKLNPIVTVKPELIGGVSVRVGDQVLDGTVRARLAQMQADLTA